MLHNITRNQVNRFLRATPLSNIMEYYFLVLLDAHGRQLKSNLIAQGHMEMSSGIEVIKRLIQSGLIIEEENPADRRSKYIDITETGKNLIQSITPEIEMLNSALSTGLTDKERSSFIQNLELFVSRHGKQLDY